MKKKTKLITVPTKTSEQAWIRDTYYVSDRESPDSIHFCYNIETNVEKVYTKQALKTCLGLDRYNTYMDVRHFPSKFDYRPDIKLKWNVEGPDKVWNTYVPPKWEHDNFYSKGEIDIPKGSYPALYKKFLNHITDGIDESHTYLLDWLSNGIRGKNITYLTILGSQGIGKGVLATIIKHLFGKENFSQTTSKIVNGQFNNQLKNKRLVYINELTVKKGGEGSERLKGLSDDAIEIESKGVDAEAYRNFANIYISSNDIKGLHLSNADRRFSLIDTTTYRLEDRLTQEDIDKLLENDAKVLEFARFLYHREIKNDMIKPFISAKTAEVLEGSLEPWMSWFIYTYIKEMASVDGDVTINIKDVGKDYTEYCKKMHTFDTLGGVNKFQDLARAYPFFTYSRTSEVNKGKKTWNYSVIIPKKTGDE
jgi:hypothetical protein